MRFALLVFYAAGTLAVPVPDERIPKAVVTSLDCSSPFQQGSTTTYEYAGQTINQVEGTTNSNTGLHLRSLVSITAVDDCLFLMRLTESEVRSKSMNEKVFTKLADSEAFRQNIEAHPLLFTMKGKKIATIRPDQRETTEALNIKRGILSTFQLDTESTVETDVNGECKTTITKHGNEIIKSKSLSECSKRSRSEIGIQSASIRTEMDLKPLDSKSVCTYSMGEDGDMTMIVCKETHLFKPFSAGYKTPSGAMTTVNQKIKFVDRQGAQNVKYDVRSHADETDMAFQHAAEEEEETNALNSISPVDEVMNKLIVKSAKDTSAKEFTSLVMLLRKMNEKMMKSVWEKYFDCAASKVCGPNDMNMKDLYRQYMLDAIAYCGTPSCVSVVKDVTISGEVEGERANMFLMSIALVAKTTNEMIRDVLDIAQHKPSRQVFLTLGTLISRHCAKYPESCEKGPVVDTENFLQQTLGKCSGQEHHERVEQILMTLKAIGNAKRPLNLRKALLQCAAESTHTNITMSAFNAIKSMPCDEATLGELNRLIADHSINEEKRIYAFQASVNCPSRRNLEELVRIYNAEPANQLSSFVWTHLTNLNESSNPANKEAKETLAAIIQETPLKKNNLPIYSHSKNFEKSLYIDYLKSGVSGKANLVFNPESILPKTAMFDMTAKVMGVPVDLVETVVGIDGVESLLDNIQLPEVFAFDMFKQNLAEKFQEMQQKKEVIDRIRRKANPEIIKPKQLSGFMSMKVMGQEVRVMSYDDIFAMIEEIDNMNVIQLLSKIAKGGEKTFSKSMMFLEMTYTVPTGFGFPLKLKLTGTTVGSVEMSGKLDMRNMFWGPGALSVNGFVKPSAVVEITGKMGLESKYVSTGLLVSSNMMVSNLLKGAIQYKAGQILKINVDTPAEPVQLIKSSSTPYMYMNEKTDVIEGVERMINADKCIKSQLIGYGLCTSVRLPVAFREYEAPYFPLSGPAHAGVSLVRGDDKLTTFEFLMSMTKKTNGLEGIIEVSAPGAVYERKLSGQMSYTDADNKKVLKLSAEPYGRVGSVEFTYDTVSRSASMQAKNNFFTSKDIIATVSIQNQTNAISTQYGIVASLQHDWYKFEHVAKYMTKSTGHKLLSTTTYAPNKAVSASLEFNTVDKKLTANVEMTQFKQALELSGQVGSTSDGNGLIVTATHMPSKKTVTLFGGYKNEELKKEVTTSLTSGDNIIKNTLGWYKNGGINSIENVFAVNQKTAKVVAALENKDNEKSLKVTADVFGKTAMSRLVYTSTKVNKMVELTVEALGKSGKLNGVLDNKDNMKSLTFNADIMGRKANSAVIYTNEENVKSLTFNADIMGRKAKSALIYTSKNDTKVVEVTMEALEKTAKLTATLDSKKEEKSLKLNANVMGHEAITTITLTNKYDEKVAKVTVSVNGKTAEGSVGYYRENDGITFQVDGVVAGKSAKLFWIVEKVEGYKSALGFVVDKYAGGVRTSYVQKAGQVGACSSVYYGASKDEKTAVTSCIALNDLSKEKSSEWQVKANLDLPGLKKKVELISTLSKDGGNVNMVTKALYNDNVVAQNEVDVDYKGPSDSSIKLSAKVSKYDVNLKAYTKKVNDAVDIRFEMSSIGKSLEFVNKYEKSDAAIKVTSSVNLNGKALPLSTTVSIGLSGSTISVMVGEYSLNYNTKIMYSGKYGWSTAVSVMKKDKVVYGIFNRIVAKLTEVDHKFGFVLLDKPYEYGWSIEYSKATLIGKIQYATKRSSKVTISFKQDTKMASVDVIVEYIPTKSVSHSARYNKEKKQLDISVEFLPKMFAKYMARLETKDGYQLITDVNLEWKNFNAAVNTVSSYVNTDKKIVLSMKVGEKSSISITYNKASPKSITLKVYVLGKTASISVSYINKVITLQVDANGKIFKFVGDINKITEAISAKGKVIAAHLKDGYGKVMKDLKAVIDRLKQWATVTVASRGSVKAVTFNMFGGKFKRLVYNAKRRTLSIVYKRNAAITVKHLPKTKAISITLKGKSSSATLILRADWEQKIASVMAVYNKATLAGIRVYIDKVGLNFKVIATQNLIFNTAFSYTDNTLEMKVNRIADKQVINEVTLQYVLSKGLSEFVFKWNKDSLSKVKQHVQELGKPFAAKAIALLHEVLDGYTSSLHKLKELAIEVKGEILKLMNRMDKAFDDIDFVAVRDEAGAMTLKALKKVSTVTYNALVKLAGLIENLKERIPGDAEKLKKMIKEIKPEVAVAKAKVIIKEVAELLKKHKMDIAKQLDEVKEIVIKVVKNFTDTTTPVLKKAVTLLKEFKIRGKTMEVIFNEATAQCKKYIKLYIAKANTTLTKLKVKAHELTAKVTAHVMNLEVPYTNKTVAQVLDIIKVKLTELKEKVKSLDVKKLAEEMKVKIMAYKISGKTIKEHLVALEKKVTEIKQKIIAIVGKYKDLPEQARKELHRLVSTCRKYVKNVDVYVKVVVGYINKVTEFAKPLNNYIKIVLTSIKKHYGPLYVEVHDAIVKELKKIKLPSVKAIIEAKLSKVSDFVLPLIKPLVPLYKSLKEQVRKIKVDGMELGTIFDDGIARFDKAIEELTNKAKQELKKETDMLQEMIVLLKASTADEMIDKSIDKSVKMVKEIADYLTTIYSQKKELTTEYLKKIKEAYEKVKAQLTKITSRPVSAITEEVFDIALNKTVASAAQVSGMIKQIASIDIARPSWKAWVEADVIAHFGKYGINEKIMNAIKYAKDLNMTQIVLDVIAKIETVATTTSQEGYEKVLKEYQMVKNNLLKVIEYIKSISKKDYETWFAEMKNFATKNEKMLIQWAKDVYATSEKRVTKAYETMKKLATADAKIASDYITLVQKYYNVVVAKGRLVYGDVKQPTIDVYNHYNTIISKFVTEQYNIIKAKIIVEYKRIYAQLKAKVAELKAKLPELKEKFNAKLAEIEGKVKKMYDDFMTKYGSMTWEEIAGKLEKLSLEKYEMVKSVIVAKYGLASKKIVELKGKAVEVYKKAVAKAVEEYKKIVPQVKAKYAELIKEIKAKYVEIKAKYEEIKPKVIAALKKYEELTKQEVLKMMTKVKGVYSQAKGKLTAVYENNKQKSLRMIFNEIKEFIINNYLKQQKAIRVLLSKNYQEIKEEVTDFYKKVETSMKNTIIPEIKQELESIINQTLRNTVVMSGEIIHAYTPYAILTKDAANKAIAVTKEKIQVLVAKVKGLLKMDLPKVKEMIKATVVQMKQKLKDLKELECYKKLVALVEEEISKLKANPTFMKIKKEVEEIIAKVEKFVKDNVEELKKNPSIIKLQGKIVEAKKFIKEKVEELKRYIKAKVEELKQNPTYLEIKAKVDEQIAELRNLTTLLKSEIETIRSGKEVAQIIATLKQIKVSGKFTIEKLQENLKATLDTLEGVLNKELAAASKLALDFIEHPEETFWVSYRDATELLIGAYSKARATSLKQLVDAGEKYFNKVVAFSKDLVMKCTDKWTQETAKKAYDELVVLVTKMKEEYKKMKADLPVMMKKYYNEAMVSLKSFVHKYTTKAEELMKKQIVMLKKYWETSPFKAFVETPVFGEIVDEIKNHELVALANDIKDMVVKQLVVLKGKAMKIYEEKKVIVQKKYAELKTKVSAKYNELKNKSIEAYQNTVALLKKVEKLALKIVDTKIVDIVAIIETKYQEAVKKLESLKTKYAAIVNKLYAKYEQKAKELYKKVSAKVTEYKGKMMEAYKKATLKVKEMYTKYRPIVEKEYKRIVEKMTAKYNELKEMTMGKYKEVAAKAKELLKKYKSEIIEEYAKLLKKWNESVIREKLVGFSKMTIKETIEALKKIPVEIKKFVTAKYGKLIAKTSAMLKELSEKVKLEVAKIMKKLQPYVTSVTKVYKLIENEVMETGKFIYSYYGLLEKYNMIKAFTVNEMNKVVEQAKVMLKKYKDVMSLLPDKLKKQAEKYLIVLKKYTKEYKQILTKKITQCVDVCKTKVAAFTKDAVHFAKVAGDRSLRSIHSGFKNVDKMEVAMTKLISDIRERVKVTRADGEVVIGFVHPEIVPSFSHQIENIKAMPKKVLNDLKKVLSVLKGKGKEIADKIMEKINELKKVLTEKIATLKIDLKKYVQLLKEEAPIVAAQIKEIMNRYVAIMKLKIADAVTKGKEVISKLKTDIATAQKLMETIMEKLETKVLGLKESIESNPNFKKFVVFAQKQLNGLKEVLNKEVVKGKEFVLKTMETLKIKGNELVKKLQEKIVVLKATIKKYIEDIKSEAITKAAEIKVIVTEYMKVLKKKTAVMVQEARVIVETYTKLIKEKVPVVVAKVKSTVDSMMTKVKVDADKAKKMIKTVAAKIELNLKELRDTITKDARYIKIAAFVEKMLKELKKLIKENVARGKEIAQKAMDDMKIKGKELITKIEAKLNDLKHTIVNRVKLIKEKVPAVVAKAKESIKDIVAKLDAKLKELKQTITNDERYVKFVAFVEKKISELKKYIQETVEGLKTNPTLLKIKAKVESMKKQIPIMVTKIESEVMTALNKSKVFIKVNLPKLEKKLKDLIATIKSNEVFIMVDKRLTKLMEMIKAKIEELKTNPTVLKIKSKGLEMVKSADEAIKKNIDLMKKEVPIMVAKAKDTLNMEYKKLMQYVKATITKLEEKFNSLKKTVISSDEYAMLIKKLNQLKDFIKEKVEELKKNPTLLKFKAKIVTMINDLIKKINDNTVELRSDIMVSYNANKNITLKLYNECKIVAKQYYSKCMDKYATLKKDAVVLVEKVKTVSREQYMKLIKIYNEIAKSSFKEVCTKVTKYSKVMYASLKTQCIATYGKAEKLIKDTIVLLKKEGLNLEKELKSYYEQLMNAYQKIKSGVPVKDVLKPLLDEIYGKIEKFNIGSMICKKDPELCKLVNESLKIHKTLLKKYAKKVGGNKA